MRFIHALLLSLLAASLTYAEPRTLDAMDDPTSWQVVVADGVSLKVAAEPGIAGHALRLDYDFTKGSGYGIIRKKFDLALGPNYRFGYSIRGLGPRNTVEFKLVDPSGDNVWWVNQREFEFPREWSRIVLPRRKFSFAWGPSGGAPLTTAATIEIAITSVNGGKGRVWLDELTFEPLPEVEPYRGRPTVSVTSGSVAHIAPEDGGAIDWTSGEGDTEPAITLDFGTVREIGGLIVQWGQSRAREYTVLGSLDGRDFSPLARLRGPERNLGPDYVQTPDASVRAIRLTCRAPDDGVKVDLHAVRFMDLEFGESRNRVLAAAAADARRGVFPRYTTGEATYWTAVGVSGDDKEALVGEDGAVEVDKLAFSLEPFVLDEGRLITWADGPAALSLDSGRLPIPTVRRTWGEGDRAMSLAITAFADASAPFEARTPTHVFVRYELTNTGDAARAGKFVVAIRPFQVNPPYQNLNITGGAAEVRTIEGSRGAVRVDQRWVLTMSPPDGFGASTFDAGEIARHLSAGVLPTQTSVTDPRSLASGALWYEYDLGPGESRVWAVAVPFHGLDPAMATRISAGEGLALVEERLSATREHWSGAGGMNRTRIRFPAGHEAITDSIGANLAYLLINRDGPAIQPGSRCYERTWIRDGSLTSTALLALGHWAEVREFLDWFAGYQYANGKVPCCVDRRGPDPVPEHDSHGQYIYAVRTLYEHTGDLTQLRRHWPHVVKAVEYIRFLREQRMTDEYRNGPPEKRVLFGLVPESISHEGYSAKPMHSYWDDFWTLKGLADAVRCAEELGETSEGARIAELRDDFRRTLADSIRFAISLKNIDYIPGCAELGDFDATSTTIAIWPCGAADILPPEALKRTFDRYWQFANERRTSTEWRDYTPYENRTIGSMVLLGRVEQALALIEFQLAGQRPAPWRQWPEVVFRDDRQQGYVGDMPHTWCGSDFINSVVLMLAHRRESDGALIVGRGLPREWICARDGVSVENLHTSAGILTFSVARGRGGTASAAFEVSPLQAHPSVPRAETRDRRAGASVHVAIPDAANAASVMVSAQGRRAEAVQPDAQGLVRLAAFPARVDVTYRASTDAQTAPRPED